ncbi:MAG: LamG domain-containing protein, partial [Patescibacteria group bacterium]|nr:LamG domain-containing protein [Patescibacteria group bacterium]
KYQQTAANSGNPDPTTYAIGSNLSITPFIHGLVADYTFDNPASGVGAITTDSSGWGNNGTLEDTTSTGTGPFHQTTGCVSGDCYSFDGSDDYVITSNSSTLSPQNFSIVSWLKWDGNRYSGSIGEDWAAIVSKGTYGSGEYTILMLRASGGTYTQFNFYINGTLRTSWNMGTSLDSTNWHNLSAVYDGSNAYLYFDGTLRASSPVSVSIATTTNALGVGSQANGGYNWGGLLDNITLFNYGLKPSQV